ncbi:MAG: ligase-associated DNA damage response DEXH box helicase [Pseudomonadota bacterium]
MPDIIAGWFRQRHWSPHRHQLEVLDATRNQQNVLLIAPTGAGKTLAGFLPSLTELVDSPDLGTELHRLHTLYISPLKALAVDIQRNLERPIAEMRVPIRVETRTGDTPNDRRRRQMKRPPHMLMTTPESLALMLSTAEGRKLFRHLKMVVLDELHALADNKRGELLALNLAHLRTVAPQARVIGLSATVAYPDLLTAYLSKTPQQTPAKDVAVVRGRAGAQAELSILHASNRVPWAGHMALHSMPDVYEAIKKAGMTILFVNTRAQAELCFQELWRANDDGLPIALHHGSLDINQRRKVEAAMAAGKLKAVVATSSLDLGLDWGDVDLVMQIGAPKGVSRLLQRIGRANHRLDEASQAVLVPANRFEYLECQAAMNGVAANNLDGEEPREGGLDILAQHILGRSCGEAFLPDELYREVITAAPYANLSRQDFEATLQFVTNGGYSLRAYERYHRLTVDDEGRFKVASRKIAASYRMNVGTIVEATTYKVRINRGRVLGSIEEYFVQGLTPGDTFIFGGELLAFMELKENTVMVTRAKGRDKAPKVPAYVGGRMPLSTYLATQVRELLSNEQHWRQFPEPVQEWLKSQKSRSVLPPKDGLLVETFERQNRHYLIGYVFEGRNAHQTLGMLLTRRMERAGYKPMGFAASDYVIAVWSVDPPTDIPMLFDQDMLGDDLEAWMAESSLLRRTFARIAVITGLVEKNIPGGRQRSDKSTNINTDLIYDVLRQHEPDHILLRATRADAARGMTDIRRLADMLTRVQGRIIHKVLDRVSPLAVPVMLEAGKELVYGEASDAMLESAAEALIAEAMDT